MRAPQAAKTTADDPGSTRRYRSPLRTGRAAETRHAVLTAATELFVANGWAATGMRDVATAAGVALETVYAHFSSKPGLLRAVADAAVMGDERPLPLAERPEFLALGQGRRSARISATARLLTGIQGRMSPIARVLLEAAPADAAMAELLHATREDQRVDIEAALELVIGRPPTVEERDGVWAIASPEVYLLLTDESGWTPEQYEQWFAQTIERVIPRA